MIYAFAKLSISFFTKGVFLFQAGQKRKKNNPAGLEKVNIFCKMLRFKKHYFLMIVAVILFTVILQLFEKNVSWSVLHCTQFHRRQYYEKQVFHTISNYLLFGLFPTLYRQLYPVLLGFKRLHNKTHFIMDKEKAHIVYKRSFIQVRVESIISLESLMKREVCEKSSIIAHIFTKHTRLRNHSRKKFKSVFFYTIKQCNMNIYK